MLLDPRTWAAGARPSSRGSAVARQVPMHVHGDWRRRGCLACGAGRLFICLCARAVGDFTFRKCPLPFKKFKTMYLGQGPSPVWPATCFCTIHKLTMVSTFLNDRAWGDQR